MKRLGWCVLVLGVAFFFASCHCKGKAKVVKTTLQSHTDMSLLVRTIRTELGKITDSGTLYGEVLNFADTLNESLSQKKVTEDWFIYLLGNNGKNFNQLLQLAAESQNHGLQDSFYHRRVLAAIGARLKKGAWDKKIPYDSLALTMIYSADAALGLYHDFSCGRVDPSYTGSLDVLPRRKHGNLTHMLVGDTAVAAIDAAIPRFEPYRAMQLEYKRLLCFPEDQLGSQLVFVKKVRRGDSLPAVHLRAIARKLRMQGYLTISDSLIRELKVYEGDLVIAVQAFQLRHNLDATGIIDKKTRELLNTTREEMLLRLQANLERWRWLGPVTETSRIWVNIAENRVYAFKQDTLKLAMKVCSGKSRDTGYYKKLEKSKKDPKATAPDNLETPLMKATLSHMVVNPSWFVPRNIMTKEMLPQLKNDPGILAEKHYLLKNNKGEEIDPYNIDWGMVTAKNWRYRIEQEPGEENALGRIVIHFPNSYSIFMHDTPSKNAFDWLDRHVSHGCVRMEEPLKMAEFITSFQKKDNIDDIYIAAGLEPFKDEKKVKKYLEDMRDSAKAAKYKPVPNKYFKAEEKIPVYLVYFTCSLNEHGGLDYFADSYDRDKKLLREMGKPRRNKMQPKANTTFSP